MINSPIFPNSPWLTLMLTLDLSLTWQPKSSTNSVTYSRNLNLFLNKYPDFEHIYTGLTPSSQTVLRISPTCCLTSNLQSLQSSKKEKKVPNILMLLFLFFSWELIRFFKSSISVLQIKYKCSSTNLLSKI